MLHDLARTIARLGCVLVGGGLAVAIACGPAAAAIVEFTFVAPVTSGPFAGQAGSGAIRFDSASTGTLTPLTHPDLEIDFSFLGQTFHEDNDSGFPGFPEVTLIGGVPVQINFLLEQGLSNVDFLDASIGAIALQGVLLPSAAAGLVAPIDIVPADPGGPDPVPEPASAGLVGLALLGLAASRRQRRSAR